MAYRLNDFGGSEPTLDASVVVGFIVVLAISIGSFIWVSDLAGGHDRMNVRVYQQTYMPEQTGEESASAPVQAIDTENRTSSLSTAASDSAKPAEPQCNIDACADAYRSFRVSDCTYQPYEGPRRLCTR